MSGGDGGATGVPAAGRGRERAHRSQSEGGPVREPGGRRAGASKASVSALVDAVLTGPTERAPDPADESDLQSVLGAAVRDLARRTAAPRVCAWLSRPEEPTILAAARWTSPGEPPTPSEAVLAVLRGLPQATDLADGDLPALSGLAHRGGLTAAVAVSPSGRGGQALSPVVLAVGGPDDPPGRVRPRTLAMLEEAATRLTGPLATGLAFLRLARLDDVIRSLDRRAALGELVAEIVHEVRNPLVSVKTFLQLLPNRLDDPEFLEDFRGVVIDEVMRLERLLDSVLQHARPSGDDPAHHAARVVEVFDAVTRLLDHRASDRRVRLEHQVAPGVASVALPRDALRQVILNLALNALAAAPEGGRVRLHAAVLSAADGRFVEIRVEDDGPGIPVEERHRIFEAFRTSHDHRPGGLGLAISRRLVESAGGTIRAEDAPGGGAALTVRLPTAPTPRREG